MIKPPARAREGRARLKAPPARARPHRDRAGGRHVEETNLRRRALEGRKLFQLVAASYVFYLAKTSGRLSGPVRVRARPRSVWLAEPFRRNEQPLNWPLSGGPAAGRTCHGRGHTQTSRTWPLGGKIAALPFSAQSRASASRPLRIYLCQTSQCRAPNYARLCLSLAPLGVLRRRRRRPAPLGGGGTRCTLSALISGRVPRGISAAHRMGLAAAQWVSSADLRAALSQGRSSGRHAWLGRPIARPCRVRSGRRSLHCRRGPADLLPLTRATRALRAITRPTVPGLEWREAPDKSRHLGAETLGTDEGPQSVPAEGRKVGAARPSSCVTATRL